MSIDFTKEREAMEKREAAAQAWLDALAAERAAEQRAQDMHNDALDADLKAVAARKATKDAFERAKAAILEETEFAGYGFTGKPVGEVDLRPGDIFWAPKTDAADITEAVRAIADEPPAAPDPSDQPEMTDEDTEGLEAVLFDREGA